MKTKLFFVGLLISISATAQIVEQKGLVRTIGRPENPNGKPLKDAIISIAGQQNSSYSNDNGKFSILFNGVRPGYDTYIIDNVVCRGYHVQSDILQKKCPISPTVEKEIVMSPDSLCDHLKRLSLERMKSDGVSKELPMDMKNKASEWIADWYSKLDYARLLPELRELNTCIELGDYGRARSIMDSIDCKSIERTYFKLKEIRNNNRYSNHNLEYTLRDKLLNIYNAKIALCQFPVYTNIIDTLECYCTKIADIDSCNLEIQMNAGSFSCENKYFENAWNCPNLTARDSIRIYSSQGTNYRDGLGEFSKAISCYSLGLEISDRYYDPESLMSAGFLAAMRLASIDSGNKSLTLNCVRRESRIRSKHFYEMPNAVNGYIYAAELYNEKEMLDSVRICVEDAVSCQLHFIDSTQQYLRAGWSFEEWDISKTENPDMFYDDELYYSMHDVNMVKEVYAERVSAEEKELKDLAGNVNDNYSDAIGIYNSLALCHLKLENYSQALRWQKEASRLVCHLAGIANYNCRDYSNAKLWYVKESAYLKELYGDTSLKVAECLDRILTLNDMYLKNEEDVRNVCHQIIEIYNSNYEQYDYHYIRPLLCLFTYVFVNKNEDENINLCMWLRKILDKYSDVEEFRYDNEFDCLIAGFKYRMSGNGAMPEDEDSKFSSSWVEAYNACGRLLYKLRKANSELQ